MTRDWGDGARRTARAPRSRPSRRPSRPAHLQQTVAATDGELQAGAGWGGEGGGRSARVSFRALRGAPAARNACAAPAQPAHGAHDTISEPAGAAAARRGGSARRGRGVVRRAPIARCGAPRRQERAKAPADRARPSAVVVATPWRGRGRVAACARRRRGAPRGGRVPPLPHPRPRPHPTARAGGAWSRTRPCQRPWRPASGEGAGGSEMARLPSPRRPPPPPSAPLSPWRLSQRGLSRPCPTWWCEGGGWWGGGGAGCVWRCGARAPLPRHCPRRRRRRPARTPSGPPFSPVAHRTRAPDAPPPPAPPALCRPFKTRASRRPPRTPAARCPP